MFKLYIVYIIFCLLLFLLIFYAIYCLYFISYKDCSIMLPLSFEAWGLLFSELFPFVKKSVVPETSVSSVFGPQSSTEAQSSTPNLERCSCTWTPVFPPYRNTSPVLVHWRTSKWRCFPRTSIKDWMCSQVPYLSGKDVSGTLICSVKGVSKYYV